MPELNPDANKQPLAAGQHPVQVLPKRRFFARLEAVAENFHTALPLQIEIRDAFTVDHALKVLRLKPGESVLIIDETSGQAFVADLLKSDDPKALSLSLTRTVEIAPAMQDAEIILMAALIKEQHWEWMLQKATELGVRKILPLETRYCDIRPRMNRPERWKSIAKAAVLQSEGVAIPEILDLSPLSQGLDTLPADADKFLLLERSEGAAPLLHRLLRFPKTGGQRVIIIAIGPEGGWHDDEIALMLGKGFEALSLGRRILRADTAAVAALGIIRQALEFDVSPEFSDSACSSGSA